MIQTEINMMKKLNLCDWFGFAAAIFSVIVWGFIIVK